MRHVTAIRQLLDQGQRAEAKSALEDLLSIGPSNLEALKLKALLYAGEGRFPEEEKVWLRILEIDREDPDAIQFIIKKQIEDREHYYFTDDLTGGGRRFLAYPRLLIRISMLGLIGCVSFLMLTRVLEAYPDFNRPEFVLSAFGVMVISPWLGILWTYFRSVRSVSVTRLGLEVATRTRAFRFTWAELGTVSLSHSQDPNEPNLRLVLIPRDQKNRCIIIDLNEETSAIRARTHFVHELHHHCANFTYDAFEALSSRLLRPFSF